VGVWEQGAGENIWTVEGGSGRGLQNDELRNFYASPYIISVIKPKMSWEGQAARMWEMRTAYVPREENTQKN
jgi:hypothetical protein